MSKSDEISRDIDATINTQWNKRNGQKIPDTSEVTIAGGAVGLEATFLYADLANSSKMVKELDQRVAAKIIKSFLAAVSKMIIHMGGEVKSFDGDRVMGVFIGNYKNTNAAKCSLHIKYIVHEIIRPKFENKYPTVKNATFRIDYGVGIDTGTVLVVRGGVRGNNDLIWIDRAPNLAAKLSDIRQSGYPSYITAAVYGRLNAEAKFQKKGGQNMWEQHSWTFLGEKKTLYRSNFHWKA